MKVTYQLEKVRSKRTAILTEKSYNNQFPALEVKAKK